MLGAPMYGGLAPGFPMMQAPVYPAQMAPRREAKSYGQGAHEVARALPEFRPPVFLGHLPYPDSPDSVKSAPSPGKDDAADTSEVKMLHRRVAELEREKNAADDALRRAVLKLQAQEQELAELRAQLQGQGRELA